MNAERPRFGTITIGEKFLYRSQLYQKVSEEFAVLLRFDHGEYLTEHVGHRFEHHLSVDRADN